MKICISFLILVIFFSCSKGTEDIINETEKMSLRKEMQSLNPLENSFQLKLTIQGSGKVLSPMDQTTNLGGTENYPKGTLIQLIAEKENFLYWIVNGEKISAEANYEFYLEQNTTIVAVTKNALIITVTGAGAVDINGSGSVVVKADNSPYRYYSDTDEVILSVNQDYKAKFYGWEEQNSNMSAITINANGTVTAAFGEYSTTDLMIDSDVRDGLVTIKGYAYVNIDDGSPDKFETNKSDMI